MNMTVEYKTSRSGAHWEPPNLCFCDGVTCKGGGETGGCDLIGAPSAGGQIRFAPQWKKTPLLLSVDTIWA